MDIIMYILLSGSFACICVTISLLKESNKILKELEQKQQMEINSLKLMGLVDDVANDIYPKLKGRLRCNKCKATKPLSSELVVSYIRNGWPTCCGDIMTWQTEKEQQEHPDEQDMPSDGA